MQIDGHHTLTYVLSRMAGFEHDEANIIAHSAQYVDDATNSGNDYRLIVKVQYKAKFVFIRFVGTHEEYNNINAKEV